MARRCLLFCSCLVLAGASPTFDGLLRPNADGSTEAYMIPPYKSNHASTIEALPDGTLVGAWFSGEKEEASGCAIVFSSLISGAKGWSPATTLSKRDGFSNQNPVLFYDNSTGILHLFHSQAKAESGEGTSTIWHLSSSNKGLNWTTPEVYFDAPGSFPRNRIIRRHDGKLLFPYYSQAKGHANWPVMAVSADASVPASQSGWSLYPIKSGGDLVQPSCLHLPQKQAVVECFFRDRRAKNIYVATSLDEGQTFSSPSATVLPNNNAGIEAYPLVASGSIVMVFNPQTHGRDPLAIALSEDGGKTWPYQRLIQHGVSVSAEENSKGNEFSYPTVMQVGNSIHVMYTYNRQTIKYVKVDEAWIKQKDAVSLLV